MFVCLSGRLLVVFLHSISGDAQDLKTIGLSYRGFGGGGHPTPSKLVDFRLNVVYQDKIHVIIVCQLGKITGQTSYVFFSNVFLYVYNRTIKEICVEALKTL